MLREGVCKYWDDVCLAQRTACRAGIDIAKLVNGDVDDNFQLLPCFRRHETTIKCDRYKEPTTEEIEEYKKQMQAVKTYTLMITTTIRDQTQGQKGASGNIKCPCCGSTIDYLISDSGFLNAQCRNLNCIKMGVPFVS